MPKIASEIWVAEVEVEVDASSEVNVACDRLYLLT
jgi:hypothetical protein